MAKKLISTLYIATALLLLPPLLFFMMCRRELRSDIWRRFFPAAPYKTQPHIWFHAASSGECRQAAALARHVKNAHPDLPLLLTANTASGMDEARRHGIFDVILGFPFDMPFSLNRIFRYFSPRILVVIESEYWPGLLHLSGKFGVPVIAANARLGDRSAGFFRVLNILSGNSLKLINFATADESEFNKLLKAGMPANRLHDCGNIKMDMFLSESPASQPSRPTSDPVWLAASTHRGEEDILLKAFAGLRKKYPSLRLLIAPRYVGRADKILRIAQNSGFSAALSESTESDGSEIEIIGEFGKLAGHFARADLVFVGASLVKRGGHNLLEPILAGKPLFYGPHIERWRRWSEMLLSCGAARIVENSDQIENIVADFLDNYREKSDSVARAQNLLDMHRGALLRNSELILEIFERYWALAD